jgi:branched-chain amino acid transport system permease protein
MALMPDPGTEKQKRRIVRALPRYLESCSEVWCRWWAMLRMGAARAAMAFIVLAIAACADGIEPDEARLCRLAVPALNDGAALALDVARKGPFPLSIRIDYRVIADGRPDQARFVICRFAAARNAQGRRDLVGLATEHGPMADASFYFLRRFYLQATGAAPVDPAPPARY